MKLKIGFIALFIAITNVFSQSYEVTYQKGNTLNDSQLQNIPEEIKAKLKSMVKTYVLSIDGDKSLFREVSSSPQSINSQNDKENITSTITTKTSKYDLYKNLKNNNFYAEAELGNEEYNIAGELPNLAWKTTTDTEVILGYKVKKAEGEYRNKPISVWYTEEIPVQDGPFFYRGVNGLVLKVEYGRENYIVTNIQKQIKQKISIPTSKNTITLDEYNKKKQEMVQKLRGNGGGVSINKTTYN